MQIDRIMNPEPEPTKTRNYCCRIRPWKWVRIESKDVATCRDQRAGPNPDGMAGPRPDGLADGQLNSSCGGQINNSDQVQMKTQEWWEVFSPWHAHQVSDDRLVRLCNSVLRFIGPSERVALILWSVFFGKSWTKFPKYDFNIPICPYSLNLTW